jgi:uncharacterized protein
MNEGMQNDPPDSGSTGNDPMANDAHAGGEGHAPAAGVNAGFPAGFTTRQGLHPALFGFLVVVATFVTYQVIGGIITFLIAGAEVTEQNVQVMRAVTMGSQFLLLMAPALIALRLQGWPAREVLKIRAPRLSHVVLVSIAAIALQLVFQSYTMAQDYVVNHYLIPDSLQPLFKKFNEFIEGIYLKLMVMRSPGEMLFVILVIAVTPALCEEVLFRGVVQDAFGRSMRLRWSFLLSAIIFAVFHFNPMAFIPITVLGVFFSIIVWRGRSLFLSIIAHVVNNAFAVLSLYFGGDTSAAMHDAAVGPSFATALWLSAIALPVFLACVYLFWRDTRPTVDPAFPTGLSDTIT